MSPPRRCRVAVAFGVSAGDITSLSDNAQALVLAGSATLASGARAGPRHRAARPGPGLVPVRVDLAGGHWADVKDELTTGEIERITNAAQVWDDAVRAVERRTA